MENRRTPQRQRTQTRRHIKKADFVRNIRRLTEKARYSMRRSMMLVVLLVAILSVYIVYLMYGIAVKDHRLYTELAANTHTTKYEVFPARGNIYAQDGKELAISTFTYTIGITPKVFGPSRRSELSQADAEEEFCRILGIDVLTFRENLIKYEDESYLTVKKSLSSADNKKLSTFLEEGQIYGVRQDANQARYYPQKDLASTIVGFANKRDENIEGILGIESYYNEILSGTSGYVYKQVDNYWGQALPNTTQLDVPAEDGYSLKLTIQSDLQELVQRLSRESAIVSQAKQGSQIIILNAQTSEILAMSGDNQFDLNNPMEAPYNIAVKDWDPEKNKEQLDYLTGTYWNNRATSYPFEIGSVIKPFVLAAAFDEGKITINDVISDEFIMMEGLRYPISSYDGISKGDISIPHAIWDSRNPPFVRLSQKLGVPSFYDYLRRLGFMDETGVDIAGEVTGIIHEDPSLIDMAVTSFGEQVTFTSMQLASAYVALANGGTLMQPSLVDAYIDTDTKEVVEDILPKEIRQVFSAEHCAQIREIMIGTGRYGSARGAYLPGVEAGYKTGTSSKVLGESEDGKDNTFTNTTAMLLPAENPKYVVISTVFDIPMNPTRASGNPIREIGNYLVARDKMEVKYTTYDYNKTFADFYFTSSIGKMRNEAAHELMLLGAYVDFDAGFQSNATVASQYPVPGYNTSFDSRVWISDKEDSLPEQKVELPDFTGLTAHQARELARQNGLNVALEGENRAGLVTSQEVMFSDLAGGKEIGDYVRKYSVIILNFEGSGQEHNANDGSLVRGFDAGNGIRFE